MSRCDWCELEIPASERPIRLSTSSPPWTIRSGIGLASQIASASSAFSATIKAATGEPDVTLWFHRPCWDKFYALLRGRTYG